MAETMTETMTKHHPFGPSVLYRRDLCPGSYKAELNLPELPGTKAAAFGTKMHEGIATWIQKGALEQTYTQEEMEFLNKMFSMYKRIASEYEYLWTRTEEPLKFIDMNGALLFSGTADVVMNNNSDCITIIDWKTGFQMVPQAKDNHQGAAYALAAMQTFQKTKCRVIFYNPAIDQFTECVFSNWKVLYEEIAEIITKAQAEDAPRVCGERQCQYCKAARHGTCPTLRASLTDLSMQKERPYSLDDLTDQQLSQLLDQCRAAAPLIEEIDKKVRERITANGICGQYKLKERAGARKIENILEAYQKTGLNSEEFLACCSVSVLPLEKAFVAHLKEKKKKIKSEEAKAIFNEVLGDTIVKKEPTKMLVRIEQKELLSA